MNIKDAIDQSAEALAQAGIDEPRREASSLLEFTIAKGKTFLIAHPEFELDVGQVEKFTQFIVRRARREPFHYITGRREFFGLEFFLEPGVLIPRSETEFLVETAIDELSKKPFPRFLEIGVGSGCISISLLKAVSDATALAVDVSETAIRVSTANAARHLVSDRLELRSSNLFAAVKERFDLIVSNPPYVPDGDRTAIQTEVAEYEPAAALFAGSDGLDIIRKIIAESDAFLNPEGALAMEIGFGQSVTVGDLLKTHGWAAIEFVKDLQGIERVVRASRKS